MSRTTNTCGYESSLRKLRMKQGFRCFQLRILFLFLIFDLQKLTFHDEDDIDHFMTFLTDSDTILHQASRGILVGHLHVSCSICK